MTYPVGDYKGSCKMILSVFENHLCVCDVSQHIQECSVWGSEVLILIYLQVLVNVAVILCYQTIQLFLFQNKVILSHAPCLLQISPEVGLKLHLVILPPPVSVLGSVGRFEGISKYFFVINRISSPSYTRFLFIPVFIFREKLTLQYKRKPPKLHEKALILLATRSGLKSSPFP